MTKKKRELIEILLDNVKPEDWPENLPYAVYGNKTCNCYVSSEKPIPEDGYWLMYDEPDSKILFSSKETPKHWNKTIVHRDEFMKRWNERNTPVELKTPQQLALEKFGTDWHDNEGVQPVDDEVLVDVMFFNETKSYTANPASVLGWLVERKTSLEIKKWRIHSDEKELHVDHGVKPLALDDGPMASEPVSESPLTTQIGGDHYTKLAIQPMQYSMANKLDPLQHTIIKYVTRFRDKNGIEDLEKAKHCIDMLIEFEKENK